MKEISLNHSSLIIQSCIEEMPLSVFGLFFFQFVFKACFGLNRYLTLLRFLFTKESFLYRQQWLLWQFSWIDTWSVRLCVHTFFKLLFCVCDVSSYSFVLCFHSHNPSNGHFERKGEHTIFLTLVHVIVTNKTRSFRIVATRLLLSSCDAPFVQVCICRPKFLWCNVRIPTCLLSDLVFFVGVNDDSFKQDC